MPMGQQGGQVEKQHINAAISKSPNYQSRIQPFRLVRIRANLKGNQMQFTEIGPEARRSDTPGARYLAPGTCARYLATGARYITATMHLAPSTRHHVPRSRYQIHEHASTCSETRRTVRTVLITSLASKKFLTHTGERKACNRHTYRLQASELPNSSLPLVSVHGRRG